MPAITRGPVTVRLHRTSWRCKRLRKRYRSFEVTWRDPSGLRIRRKFSNRKIAAAWADEKATELANQQTWRTQVTEADWSSFLRARQLLPQGIPLEMAAATVAAAAKRLPPGVTIEDTIDLYLEHRPAGASPATIETLVTGLVARTQRDAGPRWSRTLAQQLKTFGKKFTGPLHLVRSRDLNRWLDGLPVTRRTRHGYRSAVGRLVRYARGEGALAETWKEMEKVTDPAPKPVEARIFRPDDLVRLLAATLPNMLPFTAIAAFSGVRHEEIAPPDGSPGLDWRDIRLEQRTIIVPASVAKESGRRSIPISDNLAAWLAPYAKTSGPICDISRTPAALTRAKRRARLPSKRNETRNALRKSFISYRLALLGGDIGPVAFEAGNSPAMIRAHYLDLVTKSEAERWFSIRPTTADILQLKLL